MIGIYKIISPTNKIYIGQSINIDRRFKRYLSLDCLGQPKLYRSFNKHGVNNHIFEIIEECDIKELNTKERYWQDYYNSMINGLNCILTETDILHRIYSNKTKLKNLESLPRGINHHYSKKVINVLTLKIYNSLSECCINNNLDPKYMSRVLSNSRKNKTDFLYFKENGNYFSEIKYKPALKIKIKKTDEEIYYNRSSVKLGSKNPMYGKKGKDNPNSKQVIDTETGEIYYSLTECCKLNNLNPKYMSRSLNGVRLNKTKYKYI